MKIKMILRLAYEIFFSIINIFRTKHLYEARTGKEKQKLTAEEMETIDSAGHEEQVEQRKMADVKLYVYVYILYMYIQREIDRQIDREIEGKRQRETENYGNVGKKLSIHIFLIYNFMLYYVMTLQTANMMISYLLKA